MEKILNLIRIIFILLTISALIFFGAKKLDKKSIKKYGLFMSIFLLVFSLSGCKLIPSNIPANQNETSKKPDNIKIKSERLTKLNALSAWQKFKYLWKKLDNIPPKKREVQEYFNEHYDEYSGAIKQTEADSLKIELDETLENLKTISDENLISKKEIGLLDKISRERFQYMSWGLSSMVTRMMPSYFSINRDESIKDLERKIDVLLALKKNNTIDEKEFIQALENIQKDIEVFTMLNLINSGGSFYYSRLNYEKTTDIIFPTEKYINDFEKKYLEYQNLTKNQNTEQDLKEKEIMKTDYQNIKKEIEGTKAIFPSLRELIADLEQ
jgi:hypothetical protein